MKRMTSQVTFFTAVLIAAFLILTCWVSPNNLSAARAHKGSPVDRAEAEIQKLHTSLKITPAQEEMWNALTQVMIENAKTSEKLNKDRAAKIKTMNAVEDLKSYSEILDAHSNGIKRLIPAFEKLYNSMSEDQKRIADTVFKKGRHGMPGKK